MYSDLLYVLSVNYKHLCTKFEEMPPRLISKDIPVEVKSQEIQDYSKGNTRNFSMQTMVTQLQVYTCRSGRRGCDIF